MGNIFLWIRLQKGWCVNKYLNHRGKYKTKAYVSHNNEHPTLFEWWSHEWSSMGNNEIDYWLKYIKIIILTELF